MSNILINTDMIQIIHISDFHLDSENISRKKKELVDALITDLRSQIRDFSRCIVAISGDLIDKGGISFSSTKQAFITFQRVFVERLTSELPINKEQFFFVPGNHDVNRKKVDSIIEDGTVKKVSTVDGIKDFILSNRNQNKYLERIEDFKSFERDFYSDINIKKQLSNFDSCFITNDGIGIACLNSSWRSSKEIEDGTMVIGESQIESAIDFLQDTDIRIAIVHHPLIDLMKEDCDKVKPILYRYFDILLIGHKHLPDMEFTRNFHGTLLCCQCNASVADFSDEKYQNGYAIIDFQKGGTTKIHYRKYLPDDGLFVAYTDVGTNDGCISIDYPNSTQIKRSNIIDKAFETITNVRFDDANEHLFTYGLDPKIPCKINDLFVEPIISNIPETHSDSDEITYYHITDLVNSKDNFLIYGLKESGKTTLLNKLIIEFTENYKSTDYIPIIIDFNKLGSKRIEQLIRSFLAISSEECRSLMSNNKFVLLIDDISFAENDKLNMIIDFIKENPSSRIIATQEQILDNILPTDFLDFNAEFNFSVAYIQNFKSQQIKSLIKKWFPNKTDDYKQRIDSIIKNFEALSLPRTPLAVTLFLWIIDKQEKTPINNSLLVQQVVENLLEKTHFENIYQNKFNFQNKIRLLAFIAKKMEDDGDGQFSYRMTYSDLLDFITSYLKGKISLSPRIIVEDFVKRGILAFNNEDFVKFKFDFLFRYFLSLYFNYDSSFKEKVFNLKECLNYSDEIIYYSGLHTDDTMLLNLSQELLINVFSDLNNDLISNWKELDTFLNTSRSLTSSLKMGKIQKKPSEKELETIYDEELSHIPIKRSIEKRNTSYDQPFDKTLKFASFLFKNLEDIDNQEDRLSALQCIITSSISLMLLYRDSIVYQFVKNNTTPKGFPKNINFGVFIRLLPLLHQVLMSDWIGTEKTKLIIKEKIDQHQQSLTLSEYEKFIDIFIYADIKGSGYFDLVKNFLRKNKYKYIKDLGAIKLILYYYMRSKSKESDVQYLNLISDLKKQLNQIENKGGFIQELAKNRNKNKRKSEKE